MTIGRRGGLATATRHALACVAIFAQLLLLFTPLVELRDTESGPQSISVASISPDSPSIGANHGQAPPHNATTCPACIAQSLHAQLVASVHLPTTITAELAPTDIRNVALPYHDPPSTHRSRAPPVVS